VRRTIALEPDSVTIYQMELPFNTTISKTLRSGEQSLEGGVATWSTKRRWVGEAFDAFEKAGYTVVSGYAVVKDPARTRFVYRDRLWQGGDMIGLGVASFGHVNGVHLQNLDSFGAYCDQITRGRLPLGRGLKPTGEERLIREFVLQMKLGTLRAPYFEQKYGVDVIERFRVPLQQLMTEGVLSIAGDIIQLTRDGLLRVDTLLPRFFLPQHQGLRYT
jgi:oxygen-independent coproporphyrinogen-3 oxidase